MGRQKMGRWFWDGGYRHLCTPVLEDEVNFMQIVCSLVFLLIKKSFKKLSWSVLLSLHYSVQNQRKRSTLSVLLCLEALEKGFSCFLGGTDWEVVNKNLLSLEKLYKKIWIWNLNQFLIMAVCTAILKVYKARDMQFFLQIVQNKIFKILMFKKILIIFKYNVKLTRAVCWINSKISNRDKSARLIFLICHYSWSLLWYNYRRSLMLWNSTSWSLLTLTVKI